MTRLDALLRRVADEQDALLARSKLAERLALRFSGRMTAKPRARTRVLAFAAVVVAAAAAAVVAFARRAPLEVRAGHTLEAALVGASLGAPEAKAMPLEFSDGSRLELAPSSKARLVELGPDGARVELVSGRLKVHVAHRRSTDYRMVAGPFTVNVTGTRFEMAYAPERDAFELYLEEGQVEIQGCAFGRGRMLAAGQSVKASCAASALDVRYGRPPADEQRRAAVAEPAAPAALPSARAQEPASAPHASAPHASAPHASAPHASAVERRSTSSGPSSLETSPSWRALAEGGEYREAFAMVEALGFDVECARVGADDLALLADTARHAGASQHAERALIALRKRFAGTSEAALAAFTLGRLAFDERRAYAHAAAWFDTYLRERPAGSMAREALGRLMEARSRAGDGVGARAIAARYLREYPSGPHAELASRLVASP